jgi:gamma-glutamyltranspeptidase
VHTLVEIKKLAFDERDRHVTDPAFAEIPLDVMLSQERARELVGEWARHGRTAGPAGALPEDADAPAGDGDTVFLGVVDAQGNAVSLIQSLYSSFGSGRMVPARASCCTTAARPSRSTHARERRAPGKRPYHTLSPAMVLNGDNSLHMVLGTPGSDGQTQTLLQVFNNIVLFGMSPQRAVEAPRWRSWEDGRLQVEEGFDAACGAGSRSWATTWSYSTGCPRISAVRRSSSSRRPA